MNIYTVRENLKNTIAGKEKMLWQQRSALALSYLGPTPPVGAEMACFATIQFLEINIDELKRILGDVEACCEKASYDSWRENPDRSGGAFTQDEIDNATAWR